MIALGTIDQNVQPAEQTAYFELLKEMLVESQGQQLLGNAA